MGFILNEDRAIKTQLSGITVTDSKNAARPVGVWFGQPDIEIRQQSYPYITIDLVDISEDFTRAMRGHVQEVPYTPEGYDPDVTYNTEFPIPVSLDYQITSYARQPIHDRQIISGLMHGILPFRFGVLEIPEDGTLRRLEHMGYTKRDTTEDGKRLFVNVFSVRVSSELFPSDLEGARATITTINTTYDII